jgi:hypothetical protein
MSLIADLLDAATIVMAALAYLALAAGLLHALGLLDLRDI